MLGALQQEAARILSPSPMLGLSSAVLDHCGGNHYTGYFKGTMVIAVKVSCGSSTTAAKILLTRSAQEAGFEEYVVFLAGAQTVGVRSKMTF
jgi:hypothetical protein